MATPPPPRPNGRSPLLITAVALAAVTVVAAGLVLRARLRRPAPQDEVAATVAPPSAATAPVVAAPAPRTNPPQLVAAPPRVRVQPNPTRMAEDTLTPEQRADLHRLDAAARAQAAAGLHLSEDEISRLATIYRRADDRRAAIEARVSARTGRPIAGANIALSVSERRAWQDSAAVLGAARATALEKATADAYAVLADPSYGPATPATAAKHIVQRRLTSLRHALAGFPGPVGGALTDDEPPAEEAVAP
jgi:hypothetical protein